MKLAEAMMQRADLDKKVSILGARLNDIALINKNYALEDEPKHLFEELNKSMKALSELVYRIHVTNMETIDNGTTITAMLTKEEILKMRINTLIRIKESASIDSRFDKTIYTILINKAELQKELDECKSQLEKLDMKLQQLNWQTELI